jgi:hypothetical protein
MGMCIGTSLMIGWDVVEFFGVGGPMLQQWTATVDSTLTALRAVRKSDEQLPTPAEK